MGPFHRLLASVSPEDRITRRSEEAFQRPGPPLLVVGDEDQRWTTPVRCYHTRAREDAWRALAIFDVGSHGIRVFPNSKSCAQRATAGEWVQVTGESQTRTYEDVRDNRYTAAGGAPDKRRRGLQLAEPLSRWHNGEHLTVRARPAHSWS